MSDDEVRCECGHHCCKHCKCAEIPDPVRGYELCPCISCPSSAKECKPEDYLHVSMAHPNQSRAKFHHYEPKPVKVADV